MKPIKLFMKNIGPYRNEEIDFTKLENMFLIKGDTGAGKTFIFDAITFALYGELRGNRKGHESDFKSRYASLEEESFVEFTFEIYKKKFIINRTVPYHYINRNGKEGTKNQNVSLQEYVVEKNIGEWKVVPGKLTEINLKIKELLGLSADEFSQIVLLPQGKFAEFLHQNTNQRAETLKKLFPVEFYSKIIERVQIKNDELEEEIKKQTTIIESNQGNSDFYNAEEIIEKFEKEISELKNIEKKLINEKTDIVVKIENLKRDLQGAKDRDKNIFDLKKLEEKSDEMQILSQKIGVAEKANGLKEFIQVKKSIDQNCFKATKNLEDAESEKNNIEKAFINLDSQSEEMEKLFEQNKNYFGELKVIEEKLKKSEELEELKISTEKAKSKKDECEKIKSDYAKKVAELENKFDGKDPIELLDGITNENKNFSDKLNVLEKEFVESSNKEKIQKDISDKKNTLADLEKQKSKEEEKLARNKKTLEELENKEKENSEKNLAYTISHLLKEKCPCPVCGSLEHPFPVQKPSGLLDLSEQIKTVKDNIESIELLIKNIEQNYTKCSAEIGQLNLQLGEIKSERESTIVSEEIKNVKQLLINSENEKKTLQALWADLVGEKESLNKAEKEFNNAKEIFSEKNSELESLIKNLGIEQTDDIKIIRQQERDLRIKYNSNENKYNSWKNSFDQCKNDLASAKTKVEEFKKLVEQFKTQLAEATEKMNSQIEKSDFNSVEEVENSYLDSEKIEFERAKISRYKESLKSAQDRVVQDKERNIKPVSEIEGLLETAKNNQQSIETKFAENHSKLETETAKATRYKNDYTKIKDAQNEKLRLEEKQKPLKLLSADLSGKNPKNLKFDTWALGMYFEQVVEYASIRFNDISNGRFNFQLKKSDDRNSGNGYRGLDLLVYDNHTGSVSDPDELSGGETFEASISLALAITDVVQNNNGGVQLDSLFIDEGFGTLDPETLEKAMSVLTELGETKMIGMISHVSDIESFGGITSAINVHKNINGSKIEIK